MVVATEADNSAEAQVASRMRLILSTVVGGAVGSFDAEEAEARLESSRLGFERNSGRTDAPKIEDVINDAPGLSSVVAGDALLQLSSPIASRSERSRDLERTPETLLERSLYAW